MKKGLNFFYLAAISIIGLFLVFFVQSKTPHLNSASTDELDSNYCVSIDTEIYSSFQTCIEKDLEDFNDEFLITFVLLDKQKNTNSQKCFFVCNSFHILPKNISIFYNDLPPPLFV